MNKNINKNNFNNNKKNINNNSININKNNNNLKNNNSKIYYNLEKKIARLIIEDIKSNKIKNKIDLRKFKLNYSREYPLNGLIRTSNIIKELTKKEQNNKDIMQILTRKPIRTISGVAIVAVMCKPGICPGECIYCPKNEIAPRSYTGKEPAAMRAQMHNYDPYIQTKNRIEVLKQIGHKTDKIELIIMGGTFPSLKYNYQYNFIKSCFDAMNQQKSETLKEAQTINENTKHRNVALTIETRPDFATDKMIDNFLEFGATRIELGVQAPNNKIYKKIKRGHTLEQVISATKRLKDAGYKICYHYMPGLTKTKEKDLKLFKSMFKDPNLRPDMLKIYPLLLIEGTELYEKYKEGKYKPYSNKQATEIISDMKTIVPKYVRIMRIQRDIPAGEIKAGVTNSNLREIIEKNLKETNRKCNCIRCREAGHKNYKNQTINKEKIQIFKEKYKASEGIEYFISLENKDQTILYGYVRMRYPSKNQKRKEITDKSAIIRELKVIGSTASIGEHKEENIQHKGLGKQLMKTAEEIAKQDKKNKIIVISAIGTREYYKKLNYTKEGPYMIKHI
jgi:elongator complex protein 3